MAHILKALDNLRLQAKVLLQLRHMFNNNKLRNFFNEVCLQMHILGTNQTNDKALFDVSYAEPIYITYTFTEVIKAY